MGLINVLIADDHSLIRQGLRKVLELEPKIHIVGEAVNGEEVLDKARELKPQVILMDINMPKKDGIMATKEIKKAMPQVSIIALTAEEDDSKVFEVIRAGVSGYLLKDAEADALINAVVAASKGETLIHPSITAKLLGEFNRLSVHAVAKEEAGEESLTQRELEILQLISKGDSNKEIAQKLYISEKTVKNHISNIFRKIEVTDRTQAALYAIKNKLVDL